MDQRPNTEEPPIDVAALRRQTMGDESLQSEILAIFIEQAAAMDACLVRGWDRAGVLSALHRLLGSARAIGAWALAASVERLQARLNGRDADAALPEGRGEDAGSGDAVGEARAAIHAACRYAAWLNARSP